MRLYGNSGTSPDHVLISVFLRIFLFSRFSFVPTWMDCGETPFDWWSVYASWSIADLSGRQFPLEYGVGAILTPGSAQ